MKIAIDASRNRSGGTIAHLQGILDNLPEKYKNSLEVHIWSYQDCLNKLNEYSWLHKHSSSYLEKTIFHQIFWQRFIFPGEIEDAGCKVLFKTTASSVCPFKPCITLSQDMLPFEPGETKRYGFSFARLRLKFLEWMYVSTIKNSDGAIFLTKYASEMIQKKTGRIRCSRIIPHGVPDFFKKIKDNNINFKIDKSKKIRVIYVSEISPYKHQINVAKAISYLNLGGLDLELRLFGGGKGKYFKKFQNERKSLEKNHKFIEVNPFISQEQLVGEISSSDIFLFASSCENLPITVLEGMISGKPIASSNRGPMPEVLHDGAFFFDPEDQNSIQKALLEIIENPDLSYRKIKFSLNRSKEYNWHKSSLDTFEFFENVLENYFN